MVSKSKVNLSEVRKKGIQTLLSTTPQTVLYIRQKAILVIAKDNCYMLIFWDLRPQLLPLFGSHSLLKD